MRGLLEVATWNSTAPSGTAMATLRERSLRLLHMFEEVDEPRGMADALMNCAWGSWPRARRTRRWRPPNAP